MGRFLWNVFTRQVTSDERPSGKITEIVNRSVRKMVIGNVLPRVISWRDKWRDIYYRESACNAPLSLIQRATLLFPLPLLVGARSIFLFSLFSFSLTSSNRLMHLSRSITPIGRLSFSSIPFVDENVFYFAIVALFRNSLHRRLMG